MMNGFELPTINPNIQRQLDEVNYNKRLQADIMKLNTAEVIAKRIHQAAISFQNSLNDDEDVAMQFVQFGTNYLVIVDNIQYIDYSLVVFQGIGTDGNRVEVIQHISQLNFLLLARKKPTPEQPKVKIGFCLSNSH